ncbi:MAG: DUF427 domain-containing protein [Anaerolineaceae bacterium]|nr:DUF427 domain-containing protein [Anaerolineaceae bacterium]
MVLVIKKRANGEEIARAEENGGAQVFEGNWYFAPDRVQMGSLQVTERTYTCPYKGVCFWIDLETPDGHVARNIAWVYRDPKPGYEFIKDQIGFYCRNTQGTIAEQVMQA